MKNLSILVLGLSLFWVAAPISAQDRSQDPIKLRVEQVLATQAKAWNHGDIEGFMDGYSKSPGLRFASGDDVTHGWQSTLDRYKTRYPDRAAMGVLSFTDLDTTVLSTDAAVVFGRWRLDTAQGEPHGLFTLLFRKEADAWRIVADHTSAASSTNH